SSAVPQEQPGRDCPRCPRLVAFRKQWRAKQPSWFNAPVSTFGPLDARLLIVGLAPGLQGANRTGRPFTGDYAGILLYETLGRYGFTHGQFDAQPDDGLPHDASSAPPPAGQPAADGTKRSLPRFHPNHHPRDKNLVRHRSTG